MFKETDRSDRESAGKFSDSEFAPCIMEGFLFQVSEGNRHMGMERKVFIIGVEQIQFCSEVPDQGIPDIPQAG